MEHVDEKKDVKPGVAAAKPTGAQPAKTNVGTNPPAPAGTYKPVQTIK
jgi:hypothetical protein